MKVIVSGIEHSSGNHPVLILNIVGVDLGELLPSVGDRFDLDARLMTIGRHEEPPTPDPEDM